jgi:hypothetical protein
LVIAQPHECWSPDVAFGNVGLKVEPLRGLIRTLCDNPYGLVAGLVCLAFGGGGKSFMH